MIRNPERLDLLVKKFSAFSIIAYALLSCWFWIGLILLIFDKISGNDYLRQEYWRSANVISAAIVGGGAVSSLQAIGYPPLRAIAYNVTLGSIINTIYIIAFDHFPLYATTGDISFYLQVISLSAVYAFSSLLFYMILLIAQYTKSYD
jgi:hypothetical protein